MPATAGMATMSAGLTARLVNRFGHKVMYPAMLLAAGGLVLLASAGQDAALLPKIFFAFLMLGVGAGASFMPLLQIGMSEIPTADAGLGSGIVNVSQQMAAAVGLAVLSTIATNHTKSLPRKGHDLVGALTDGYQLALAHRGRRASWPAWPWRRSCCAPTSHPKRRRPGSPRTWRTRKPPSTSCCREAEVPPRALARGGRVGSVPAVRDRCRSLHADRFRGRGVGP